MEHYPVYDVATVLPAARDALFKNEYEGRQNPFQPLERVFMWVWFLLGHVTCSRLSCLTCFCPCVENIAIPKDEKFYDADGLPTHLIFTLTRWKGNEVGGKKCRLQVNRNTASTRFCPVWNTLMWLDMTNIQSGPLFPKLTVSKTSLPDLQYGTFNGTARNAERMGPKVKALFNYVLGKKC